jgi:hypothetical protein
MFSTFPWYIGTIRQVPLRYYHSTCFSLHHFSFILWFRHFFIVFYLTSCSPHVLFPFWYHFFKTYITLYYLPIPIRKILLFTSHIWSDFKSSSLEFEFFILTLSLRIVANFFERRISISKLSPLSIMHHYRLSHSSVEIIPIVLTFWNYFPSLRASSNPFANIS